MYDAWDGNWQHCIDGDELTTCLNIGDNFVIKTKEGNYEGSNFWLICCIKPLHIVWRMFKYKWSIEFMVKDETIERKCY